MKTDSLKFQIVVKFPLCDHFSTITLDNASQLVGALRLCVDENYTIISVNSYYDER